LWPASLILAWLLASWAAPLECDEPALTDAARAAETQKRERLWAEAEKLSEQFKWSEAITAGEQVLAIDRSPGSASAEKIGDTLEWLGNCELGRDGFAAAEKRFSEAKEVWTSQFGADNWRVIDARRALKQTRLLAGLDRKSLGEYHEAYRSAVTAGKLFEAGKYADALALVKDYAPIRKRLLGATSADYASSLNFLALQHKYVGDYAAAESLYRQALEIHKQASGTSHPDYASSLHNLARLYQDLGKYEPAVPLLVEALATQKQAQGDAHADYAMVANSLATTYQAMGQYAKAEPLFLQSLEIRKKTLGEKHAYYASSVGNLASLYDDMGDYQRSGPLYRQAVEITRQALGTAHPYYALSLNNLAMFYHRTGVYWKAEPLYLEALAIKKAALGEGHPDYATGLNNLAGLYDNMGQYARAEPLYRRVLEIRKTTLGETHPHYALSLNNLAGLYRSMGDFARAAPLYRQAVEVDRLGLGEAHPDFATRLNNLASLYQEMGDLTRAEPLLRQAMEIRRKALGETHPQFADSLNSLGRLYDVKGEYSRAEPLYRQALEIRRKTLGEAHPDFAISLNNLALAYRNLGEFARAEPLYRQAMETNEKVLGVSHPGYALDLSNLADLYEAMGDYARAEPLFRQALEIRKGTLGEAHPHYAWTLHNLALLELSQGRPAEAENHLRQAVSIQRKSLDTTGGVQSERQQLAMARDVRAMLDHYLAAALAAGMAPGEMYAEAAAWKGAIAAQQQMVRARQRALADDPNSELAKLFAELEQQTRTLAAMFRYTPKPEEAKPFQQTMDQLSESVEALQQRLSQLDPTFYQGWAERTLSSDRLTQALPDGTALVDLLEYNHFITSTKTEEKSRQERRYLAFVLRHDQPVTCFQLGPSAPINQLVEAWRKGFGASQTSAGKSPGDELRHLVWEPIASELTDCQTVLVSPDGALARLSWGALPGSAPGSYLIEERAFAVVPIPQRLPEMLAAPTSTGEASLLAVGNVDFGAAPSITASGQSRAAAVYGDRIVWPPLAGTKTEIDKVQKLFDRRFTSVRPDVLENAQATEEGLRLAAGRHRWLHLATHGFFAPSGIGSAPIPPAAQPSFAPTPPVAGIGVVLEVKAGHCLVAKVLPGGGAAKDGQMLAGDEIVALATADGRWLPAAGKALGDIVPHLRGPVGSTARIRIRHHPQPDKTAVAEKPGPSDEIELALTRAPLPIQQPAPQPSRGEDLSGSHPGLLSGIVLAGANRPLDVDRDDGILTAFEVSELNLEHVEMVVLSACETGLGQSAGGEGVLGLQRAFQMAGARTVVSGLWKVPDRATQMLMVRFYENLWQKNMPKLVALREAQLWMLREVPKDPTLAAEASRGLALENEPAAAAGQGLSPRYWAAFVLSGDWR
jgi:CHAT domain-containing protein